MTGYATSTKETDAGTITIEIKSVNSRFLDLQFRINDEFRSVEPLFRDAISKRISRGKVECRFSFGKKINDNKNRSLNLDLLDQLKTYQEQLRLHFPTAKELSVSDFLRWPGVIEEAEINSENLQEQIQQSIEATLSDFIKSREREGAALSQVLNKCIDEMESIVTRITPLLPVVLQQFQQKSINRLEEALGIALNKADTALPNLSRDEVMDRIRQEVTMYGIRIDVNEELARLSGHLNETRQIIKKGGQVGKRLDFMMQELNREANTLGSKAALKELADASMELKLLIEQMREQVQNLE
ncbi:YicC/YloC family endoribonuclease [Undibacterium cyanobacteriorum]|uniref:YicC/YloC family endoribonuclease n=1 Tax=Undibacterium cyanobacteriorum TaxID=3073561 RepID=A0ABY9RMV5_9BURK|nr:YicC/YloC family endoribonuclease [Undibacterium sp. 20NA77.5]WMW82517.1 YicC/YloC family endoribonuclease [Undibacterium sp. 20NA77.5]